MHESSRTTASPVLTIDGPSGAGKGTVSRLVAARLGWHLLDSGALYRLVALEALQRGVALEAEVLVADVAASLVAQFETRQEGECVRLNGVDVTLALRTEAAEDGASRVATLPLVRHALLERQRNFCQPPGLVADGRDMGTRIFPQAVLKVFLTASVEERARRRYKQLKDNGFDVSLPALLRAMVERDRRDSERPLAPLKPSEDAQILDTTGMEIAQVVVRILQWVRAKTLTEG